MIRPLVLPLILALVCLPTAPALAQPGAERGRSSAERPAVDNWRAFRQELAACWTVPEGTAGSNIAFRFGVDKRGAIRGTPLVTARQLKGDADARRSYEEAARALLARCFPMNITPSFGAALGESPIRLRLTNEPPSPAYQINSNITLFAPR